VRELRYERAPDRHTAVALAAQPTAKLLGGGTNLVDLMKIGVEQPELLVDTVALGLGTIESLADGTLRIGASVRNSDLAHDRRVRDAAPVLSQALLSGASGQLRNMATVGGNLLQRTRCPFFQDVTKPCNKRGPGSGCPALASGVRDLAILGASEHCVATHPSDMAVALAALDASVTIEDANGTRSLSLSDFYRLPGDRPDLDTNLPHGALVVGVDVPPLPDDAHSAYRKVRDRASFGFALASVAVVLELDGDDIADVRLALGGVAHMPWRARVAEAALVGGPVEPARVAGAIAMELDAARPLRGNAFKVPLVERLVVSALCTLADVDPDGTGR
jgi:xanthine dehydrogenase YagS FAD-binding subunit